MNGFTIIHFEHAEPFISELALDYTEEGVEEYWYTIGKAKPNYPMPATDINAHIAAPYEAVMPASKALIFRYLRY